MVCIIGGAKMTPAAAPLEATDGGTHEQQIIIDTLSYY